MTILQELTTLLVPVLPVETGIFTTTPPDAYLVLVPLADSFSLFADNSPGVDTCEVQISIYTKTNYQPVKAQVTELLLAQEFDITARRYLGFDPESGYHHYAIDVAKSYQI